MRMRAERRKRRRKRLSDSLSEKAGAARLRCFVGTGMKGTVWLRMALCVSADCFVHDERSPVFCLSGSLSLLPVSDKLSAGGWSKNQFQAGEGRHGDLIDC
mmetsp:Transcript_49535/g.97523  ORF Transcript_49535/g.97523 Transcript_49535/m.97523 type:complete len:101 (-) Transcript_49535:356-658(-)